VLLGPALTTSELAHVPTYVYVLSVGAMILVGGWRLVTGDLEPITYTPEQAALLHHVDAVGAVTVFLILRAFASGTTALTGVEAISNGVSAFRAPEAVNAKRTLMVMAVIMGRCSWASPIWPYAWRRCRTRAATRPSSPRSPGRCWGAARPSSWSRRPPC
jgi:hypothetical protein